MMDCMVFMAPLSCKALLVGQQPWWKWPMMTQWVAMYLNELAAERKRSSRNRAACRQRGVLAPLTISGSQSPHRDRRHSMKVFDHFAYWDNFTNKCSVSLQTVDGQGTLLWANDTELTFMGYAPEEYVGRFIGDFDADVAR
jgi:hypothetical protein